MPATYYPAIIDRSDSGFGVTFPDFPGCIAAGGTPSEAAMQAEGALALHVEAMAKDGDLIPDPSDLDAIEAVEGVEDVARLLVRVDRPLKVERVLVSIDSNLLRAIDAVTPNRSAWIAEAARAALSRPRGGAVYQRIEDAVRDRPGLSQAEIANVVFGPSGYQQQVNQDCAWLVREGRIVRGKGRPARYYAPEAVPADVELEEAA